MNKYKMADVEIRIIPSGLTAIVRVLRRGFIPSAMGKTPDEFAETLRRAFDTYFELNPPVSGEYIDRAAEWDHMLVEWLGAKRVEYEPGELPPERSELRSRMPGDSTEIIVY